MYYIVNIFIIQAFPNLVFNQCWHNKAMLKEFTLCMSTYIDKLHTTYLKPFIFFKGVYRLLDGAWGRVRKVSLALLLPN